MIINSEQKFILVSKDISTSDNFHYQYHLTPIVYIAEDEKPVMIRFKIEMNEYEPFFKEYRPIDGVSALTVMYNESIPVRYRLNNTSNSWTPWSSVISMNFYDILLLDMKIYTNAKNIVGTLFIQVNKE